MIALRREAIASALTAERVLELPKYVRSLRGEYWHIPRAAVRFPDRLAVSMWCGVGFGTRGVVLTDITPSSKVCGTCVGRFTGSELDEGLIFTPRDDFALPRWCPGDEPGADGLCFACGARARFGYYGFRYIRGAHRPTPELALCCSPCPDHGWRDVQPRDGRIVCRHWVGGGWGSCDFDCGPRRVAA